MDLGLAGEAKLVTGNEIPDGELVVFDERELGIGEEYLAKQDDAYHQDTETLYTVIGCETFPFTLFLIELGEK